MRLVASIFAVLTIAATGMAFADNLHRRGAAPEASVRWQKHKGSDAPKLDTPSALPLHCDLQADTYEQDKTGSSNQDHKNCGSPDANSPSDPLHQMVQQGAVQSGAQPHVQAPALQHTP